MSIETIEIWLKTSVPGIIVLGAIGSSVAVLAFKFVQYLITDIFPIPYIAHRTKSIQRAYTLGYAAATFEHDEKGHMSTIFFAYRLSRLLIALILFVSLLLAFSLALALSSEIIVTFGTFLLITFSFIALYWAYCEYEFIRFTYKWCWGHVEEQARKQKYATKEENSD